MDLWWRHEWVAIPIGARAGIGQDETITVRDIQIRCGPDIAVR